MTGQVALADIDGDGDLDILAVTGTVLGIFRNDGNGLFSGGSTSINAARFAVGDIDGDGDVDLITRSTNGSTLTVRVNACAGASCECGNGSIDGTEACDDGPTGSASCDVDCTLRACGDGLVNSLAGEQCDDGNLVATDACNACVTTTCSDGARNRDETDVDCGGSCSQGCGAGRSCLTGADCQSGTCYAYQCGYRVNFETGPLPTEFSTSGAAPWAIDPMYPIGPAGGPSTRSLISGAIPGSGASSLFLTATFAGSSNQIRFLTKTNTIDGLGALVFLIDGVEARRWTGPRRSNDGVSSSFPVTPGAHTFTWRFEKTGSSGAYLVNDPKDRAWLDDIVLIGGAP
jgi:cysteine-rich repeat protein